MCERCKHRWAQEDGRIPKDVFFYIEDGLKAILTALGAVLIGIVAVVASPVWIPVYIVGYVANKFRAVSDGSSLT